MIKRQMFEGIDTVSQLFDTENGNHCLEDTDGNRSNWMGYREVAGMIYNGKSYFGHTAYYGGTDEGIIEIDGEEAFNKLYGRII